VAGWENIMITPPADPAIPAGQSIT